MTSETVRDDPLSSLVGMLSRVQSLFRLTQRSSVLLSVCLSGCVCTRFFLHVCLPLSFCVCVRMPCLALSVCVYIIVGLCVRLSACVFLCSLLCPCQFCLSFLDLVESMLTFCLQQKRFRISRSGSRSLNSSHQYSAVYGSLNKAHQRKSRVIQKERGREREGRGNWRSGGKRVRKGEIYT